MVLRGSGRHRYWWEVQMMPNINELPSSNMPAMAPMTRGDWLDVMVMLNVHAADCAIRARWATGELAEYLLERAKLAMRLSDQVNASMT